jgi:hypothetical protein
MSKPVSMLCISLRNGAMAAAARFCYQLLYAFGEHLPGRLHFLLEIPLRLAGLGD